MVETSFAKPIKICFSAMPPIERQIILKPFTLFHRQYCISMRNVCTRLLTCSYMFVAIECLAEISEKRLTILNNPKFYDYYA